MFLNPAGQARFPTPNWNSGSMPTTRKRRDERVSSDESEDYGFAKRLRLNPLDIDSKSSSSDVSANYSPMTCSTGSVDTSPLSDYSDDAMMDEEINNNAAEFSGGITIAPEVDSMMRLTNPLRRPPQQLPIPSPTTSSSSCMALVPFVPRPLTSSLDEQKHHVPDDHDQVSENQGGMPEDQGDKRQFTLDDCRSTSPTTTCTVRELVDEIEQMEM